MTAASETTGAPLRTGSFPQTIVDDYDDTVRLTAAPTHIVSLNPTTTEILFTIGAGARLIGRSHWDTWPAATQHVPDLGNGIRPNVEAIIAAHPDLVILYASADNQPAAQRLRSVGIATLAFKTDRIAEFDRATRTLGRVIGDTVHSTIVADSVRATLNRVRAATASLPRPRVVWPFMYRPVMVVGGGSYLDELLTIAGATNVYGSLTAPSPIVSLEDVVRQDPEYILRSADTTQVGAIDPAWRAVRAVREGHVLITQTDIVGRPSVNLGMAAVQLATLLHPRLVLK
jgi:ABC-type Fe3+-hydroxamate transport system substrate-binding protein